ncbi:MAG: hypothetical protein WB780_24250 [Candidatus Acidiferrales bacterium]
MRRILGALALAVLIIGAWQLSRSAPGLLHAEASVTFYDPDPAHLWNQLHSVLFIREDLPDTARVPDALDPPLWLNSTYLLAKPSHERVLKILDEFLQTHAEKLIHDPAKRAILTRDLWAVFDWSVERGPQRPGEPAYENEKRELQARLAEVLRRLSLTSDQINSLPSNYAQAVASGQFAKDYDPARRDRPFLPPDLFDARGPWIQIYAQGPGFGSGQAAESHADAFSRSTFFVFMRLPGGRKATFDYIRALWDFPQPWLPSPDDPRHEQVTINPHLPQFPAGTEFALVRQLMLFDNQGKLQGTPITESIQIRVYRKVQPAAEEPVLNLLAEIENSGQDFYELTLSRPQLFANNSGGLSATSPKEKQFAMFNSFGADEVPMHGIRLDQMSPVLELCVQCHRAPGINSVNSRAHLLKPYWLEHDFPEDTATPANQNPWWVDETGVSAKGRRYDWGVLKGDWSSTTGK